MEFNVGPGSLIDDASIFGRNSSPSRAGRFSRRISFQSPSLLSQEGVLTTVSCVTRETLQDDCARHRFIVWAAVKRNACAGITAAERLQCPLLRCRKLFPNHEVMLQHLAQCDYLPSGEYWCHEHGRAERFDDAKCRRCLGHPTKRRKMLSMAKTFFQSLGHKQRKGSPFDMDYEGEGGPAAVGRPSSPCAKPPSEGAELSATEICELDSREVSRRPVNVVDGAINPRVLLLPELDSSMLGCEAGGVDAPVASAAIPPSSSDAGFAFQPPPRPASTPSRSKGLSPSSSVRSTTSTNSTDSNATTNSNVSSLVSPSSEWSGQWSLAPSDDTDITTVEEFFDGSSCQPDPVDSGVMLGAAAGILFPECLPELPADFPLEYATLDLASDAFLHLAAAFPTDLDPANDMLMTSTSSQQVRQWPATCCSEVKSIVATAYDALEEHIVSSSRKIKDLSGNDLAANLAARSMRSTALSGLDTLQKLLQGQLAASGEQLLCLLHLAYSLSLTLYEDEAGSRASQLFWQALAYRTWLPVEEREAYVQVVTGIWQPLGVSQAMIDHFVSQLPLPRSNSKGKQLDNDDRELDIRLDDAIMATARQFLDTLEIALLSGEICGSIGLQSPGLSTKHLQDFSMVSTLNQPSTAISVAISRLTRQFCGTPRLVGRLGDIARDVGSGKILSIRKAELELLQAAKGCMTSGLYFSTYAPFVSRLCDRAYAQSRDVAFSRDSYHRLGVALMECLLPLAAKPPTRPPYEGFGSTVNAEAALRSSLSADVDEPSRLTEADFVNFQLDTVATFEYPATPTIGETTSPVPGAVPKDSRTEADAFSPWAAEGSTSGSSPIAKTEADACCELCGYRPKGDPQWFRGSMAKHKKLQHSEKPPEVYRCPFPGCKSSFQKRPDNLRQHQMEKNHFVGEEAASRRPSKRKRQTSPAPAV